MYMSKELEDLLNATTISQDAVKAVVSSIKQGILKISMEALKEKGEFVKGDFEEEGVEIHEIGTAYWISVFPDGKIVSIGLNEKDEHGEWITFY